VAALHPAFTIDDDSVLGELRRQLDRFSLVARP
jgi:hypothetical protein